MSLVTTGDSSNHKSKSLHSSRHFAFFVWRGLGENEVEWTGQAYISWQEARPGSRQSMSSYIYYIPTSGLKRALGSHINQGLHGCCCVEYVPLGTLYNYYNQPSKRVLSVQLSVMNRGKMYLIWQTLIFFILLIYFTSNQSWPRGGCMADILS